MKKSIADFHFLGLFIKTWFERKKKIPSVTEQLPLNARICATPIAIRPRKLKFWLLASFEPI
jgi:hypothetical protein